MTPGASEAAEGERGVGSFSVRREGLNKAPQCADQTSAEFKEGACVRLHACERAPYSA